MSNCILCGSKTKSFEAYNKEYYLCEKCDFIFLNREFILDVEKEKKAYEKHNNSLENEGYVNMFEKFIDEAMEPYIKKSDEVLEFGSGPGPVLSILLRRRGYSVDIYDPYFQPNWVDDKRYDVISSTEVFEHFVDPIKNIELVLSKLKNGGILAVTTMFHPNDFDEFKKWWYPRDLTHISFYNLKTFEYLANKYNLDIVYNNSKNIVVFKRSSH